ncbi:hypothetical protein TIFTF001_006004 [Ficus carica]|uniref:Uncharacterized protein n=1 Tax=Ficus carica TaxID=3494 RepID=A0AA87ZGH1_FICCA|nr:hypothetical protein TIFTF001_006004 [Ficus carica]
MQTADGTVTLIDDVSGRGGDRCRAGVGVTRSVGSCSSRDAATWIRHGGSRGDDGSQNWGAGATVSRRIGLAWWCDWWSLGSSSASCSSTPCLCSAGTTI